MSFDLIEAAEKGSDQEIVELDEATSALTPKMRRFAVLAGRPEYSPHQAAVEAGYKNPADVLPKLLMRSDVQRLIVKERARYNTTDEVSKEEVLNILREAVQLARLIEEPRTMVAGAKEMGLIAGFYQHDTVEETVNEKGEVTRKQIRHMTTEDLIKLAAIDGEVEK